MAKLSEEIVLHVASLARLSLKKGESSKFKKQLSNIFDFVDQISQMKTTGVPETSQVTGVKNVFREDKIRKSTVLSQKEALSNAKRTYKGYFVVKAVFQK